MKLFNKKQTCFYTDKYGTKYSIDDIPEKDIKCIPFSIIETGIEALDTQNIHIINFIEKYNDISLFSRSIIGKCDKPLLNRTFSKDEINKIALSENALKKIIDTFEKQENNDENERS